MNIRHAFRLPALAMIACLTVIAPASGANDDVTQIIIEPPQVVERWYAALGSVNRRNFGELISDDAKIVLKDLGIEQTKQEFITALTEWNRVTRNANIIYRYQTIEEGTASALVCYRFRSNEQLNLESFTFSGEQITGSVQEFKGDSCRDM